MVSGETRSQALQRPGNMTDVYDKVIILEAKITAMDERLIRLEKKIDALIDDVNRTLQNTI